MTPREFSRALLAALEASEGRRRARKRDQTPDAIGLALKRRLLERAIQESPSADGFEAWLLYAGNPMAVTVLEEWRLAHTMPQFASWLERGAPSEDAASATQDSYLKR
jgi:hypothetical protein